MVVLLKKVKKHIGIETNKRSYQEGNYEIVHTADWHLGKILNGKQLLEDQKYILTQFKQHMEKEQPDLIVIAGDL